MLRNFHDENLAILFVTSYGLFKQPPIFVVPGAVLLFELFRLQSQILCPPQYWPSLILSFSNSQHQQAKTIPFEPRELYTQVYFVFKSWQLRVEQDREIEVFGGHESYHKQL